MIRGAVLAASRFRLLSSSSSDATALVLRDMRPSGVTVLTLNRPKALNALNDQLVSALSTTIKECDGNTGVKAMILTGSEKAFAAGADIKEMNSRTNVSTVLADDMLHSWQQIRPRKPLIAAVSGLALGGGCELAMMCDIIIASESAQFGQPELLLGTIPGGGGSQRLARAVGKSKAMEWILTGKRFSAQEAFQAGLVSKVVPSASLLDEAISLAEQIAKHSSPAVQLAKECILRADEANLAEGLLFERRAFHLTWGLEDRREGMTAFTEKRPAKFNDK